MPISLADAFGLAVAVLVLGLWLRRRRPARRREDPRHEPEIVRAQSVVTQEPPVPVVAPQPPRVIAAANVMGRDALFRCEEVRTQDERIETHVRRIDRRGKPLSDTYVYREPLPEIIAEFIHLRHLS